MNTSEERKVIVTAFIAAFVDGVRLLGPDGAPEEALYASVAKLTSRPAFDMVVAELIEQKTVKRVGGCVVYCGPCALGGC